MLRASLKNLLSRKVRLLMSSIAIVLGVGFVVGSLIFGDMLKATFDNISHGSVGEVVVAVPTESQGGGGGAAIRTVERTISPETIDRLSKVEGAARADGWVEDQTTYVVGKNGKVVGGNGAPGLAFNYLDVPSASRDHVVEMVEGHPPTKEGELVLDVQTAERAGYVVGDEVTVVTSGAKPRVTGTLVGTVRFGGGSMAGATLVLFDTRSAQSYYLGGKDRFSSVWVTAQEGVTQEELADNVRPLTPEGFTTKTGQQAGDEMANMFADGLSFINWFLRIFAIVAVFVAAFLIVNTFNIVVGQRIKELALFRAMGASRGQVARSVLLEALVVGVLGSLLGILVGIGLAQLITVLFGAIGIDISGVGLIIGPRTLIVATVVGVLVTLVAAYLPAHRAGQVAPIQAMRDEPAMPKGSATRTIIVGGVITVLGAVGMFVGLSVDIANPLAYLGLGILLVMLGVAILSPILGRPVVLGLGAVYRAVFGQVGTMATRNSVRAPGRTATTASALMIGVTLVTMMAVFGASAKASFNKLVTDSFTSDYVVSNVSASGAPFSSTITAQVGKADGVAAASSQRFAPMRIDDAPSTVVGVDPTTYLRFNTLKVEGEPLDELKAGEIILSDQHRTGRKIGDTVKVVAAGQPSKARLAGFFTPEGLLQGITAMMSLDGFDALGIPAQDSFVYVDRDPGADPAKTRAELDAIVEDIPTVTVKSQEEFVDEQSAQIDMILYLIYALLAISFVIAVLGVINTLGLSTTERTREIGLLRAVGLSRAQLRRMITLESIIIALLGVALGLGLGVIFGVSLQRALREDGITELVVPWPPIAVFLLAAVVVGLLAAIVPAIRAARMDVLKAIQTD